MRSLVLVAACLACASHARQALASSVQQQLKQIAEQMRESGDAPDLKTLTALLLTWSPRSAFTLSGPGARPLTTSRTEGAKMQATSELMRKQQQIAQLQAEMTAMSQQGQGQYRAGSRRSMGNVLDTVLVQGSTLKTWSWPTSLGVPGLQVVLSTDGRPLEADVQLWHGPDNNPCKMRVYSEDGNTRPFSAVIATPDDGAQTVAVRNVGQMEFPLAAYVTAFDVDEPISDFRETSTIVQGGALRTYEFTTIVDSVEVMLKTDGRPLNARIELLQGPNNNKQVVELYTEDGLDRPFFAVFDTTGAGNVVRLVNTGPLEFPLFASVQPHSINEMGMSPLDPVISGGPR